MQIILQSRYSSFRGDLSPELLKKVDDRLSFRPDGYQFSKKFIDGDWDGRIRLMHKWHKNFPTGLVSKVIDLFTEERVDFKVMDARKRPELSPLTSGEVIELRDYQLATVLEAVEIGRGNLNLPTASGKTIVAAEILKRLGVMSLFVNHTKDLMYQSRDVLEKFLGVQVGIIGDGIWDPKHISVGLIQSLYAKTEGEDPRLRDYMSRLKCFMLDEVHHVRDNSWYRTLMQCDAYYRFGLTGSHFKAAGPNLNLMGLTGRVISKVTSSELIRRGYLTKPKIKIYETRVPIDSETYADVYNEGIVYSEKRNGMIADLIEAMPDEASVLVLVTRIDHGEELERLIPDAVFLSGADKSKVRRQAIEDFKAGKLRRLVATTIFDEGIDLPNMDVVILAGAGESDVKTVQRVGRVLRKSDGKTTATVIDFKDVGNSFLKKHSLSRLAVYKREKEFEIEEIPYVVRKAVC